MKSIFRNAEPFHCLRCNIVKIRSEIYQIKVIICTRAKQVDYFAKLLRCNILVLFFLENILCIFLRQHFFHAGCCGVHACTVQLFPALTAVKHDIASFRNILKSTVFIRQIISISDGYT